MKKEQGQSMMEYINSFVDKIEQLEDIGIKLPEELTSIIMLNLLPTDYENFCVLLRIAHLFSSGVKSASSFTLEHVHVRLILSFV